MSTQLLQITEEEWHTRARAARYRVRPLAMLCGVSVRTLERHIKLAQEKSPHAWLNNLRMTEARVLMLDGNSVKESAALLGYKDVSQFSKDFKHYYGTIPSQVQKTVPYKMLEPCDLVHVNGARISQLGQL